MTSNDKPTNKDRDAKAMSGIDKHFTDPQALTIGGEQVTPAALKAIFQADVDATNVVDAARTQWLDAVTKAKVARVAALHARASLKTYLVGLHGPDAVATLADFGISAPKTPGRKTIKAKADAVVRAAATRKARHTMGSKQRQAVKGTATVIVTPSDGAETPATTAPIAATPSPAPSTAGTVTKAT